MLTSREVSLKENGEKLVRFSIIFDHNHINSLKLSGDFFVYPEEFAEFLGISTPTIVKGIIMAYELK